MEKNPHKIKKNLKLTALIINNKFNNKIKIKITRIILILIIIVILILISNNY
jgi:hypothetical protein